MNRIKELRQELNMTQEELGIKLQLQKSAISKYETGRAQLSGELIKTLCSIFNVTSDYLLCIDSAENDIEDIENNTKHYGDEVYAKLVEIGFIKHGEEITDKHLEILTKIIAPQVDYAKFKLEMDSINVDDIDR